MGLGELTWGWILVILLFVCTVDGIIGAALGRTAKKGETGFYLGFFLGPIGWIIVLLLPRDQQTGQATSQSNAQSVVPDNKKQRPERDLSSDAYKIWLSKTYNVSRNDVFEKYECDEKLFDTIEDALAYADEQEAISDNLEEEEEARKIEEKGRWKEELREFEEKKRQEAKERRKGTDRFFTILSLMLLILFILGGYAYQLALERNTEEQRLEAARLAEEQRLEADRIATQAARDRQSRFEAENARRRRQEQLDAEYRRQIEERRR